MASLATKRNRDECTNQRRPFHCSGRNFAGKMAEKLRKRNLRLKRFRRPNFTYCEVEALVDSLEAMPDLVAFPNKVNLVYKTVEDIHLAWESVASNVNANSPITRDSREIKDKWVDMKARTKFKLVKIMESNTKSFDEILNLLTPIERRVVLLMKDSFFNSPLNSSGSPCTVTTASTFMNGLWDNSQPSEHISVEPLMSPASLMSPQVDVKLEPTSPLLPSTPVTLLGEENSAEDCLEESNSSEMSQANSGPSSEVGNSAGCSRDQSNFTDHSKGAVFKRLMGVMGELLSESKQRRTIEAERRDLESKRLKVEMEHLEEIRKQRIQLQDGLHLLQRCLDTGIQLLSKNCSASEIIK